MENRKEKPTINGDTLEFIDIKFDKDMIKPEVLLTTGPGKSKYISMFDLEKLRLIFQSWPIRLREAFSIHFTLF